MSDTETGEITCPLCEFRQAVATECSHCSVVFSKVVGAGVRQRPALRASPPASEGRPARSSGVLTWLLLPMALAAAYLAWPRGPAAVTTARPHLPSHTVEFTPARQVQSQAYPGATVVRSLYHWYEGASSYEAALAEARADHKPLTVYFRTDWCPSCRQFDHKLLTTAEVIDFLRYVVKVRINPESGPEENQIAWQYGVRSYPSIFMHRPGAADFVAISTSVWEDGHSYLASAEEFVGILRGALN